MPFPSVFGSLWTPHRAAAWTALFLFLLTASAYFCGVNAKRALQHAVFIVPFIALWLLSLPARSNKSRSGWQKVCLSAAVVGLLLTFRRCSAGIPLSNVLGRTHVDFRIGISSQYQS